MKSLVFFQICARLGPLINLCTGTIERGEKWLHKYKHLFKVISPCQEKLLWSQNDGGIRGELEKPRVHLLFEFFMLLDPSLMHHHYGLKCFSNSNNTNIIVFLINISTHAYLIYVHLLA